MADLSQDDFAGILMAIRQALLLLLGEIEKWLRKHEYLKSK